MNASFANRESLTIDHSDTHLAIHLTDQYSHHGSAGAASSLSPIPMCSYSKNQCYMLKSVGNVQKQGLGIRLPIVQIMHTDKVVIIKKFSANLLNHYT